MKSALLLLVIFSALSVTIYSPVDVDSSVGHNKSDLVTIIPNDTIVEFGFGEVNFLTPNVIEVDVLVRSNVEGLEFGEGEIHFDYPTSIFGVSVVQNEKVATSKGELLSESGQFYSIANSDKTESRLKIGLLEIVAVTSQAVGLLA